MQSAMEKLSNMGSVAKKKLKICRAKLDEKVEKASAKTVEERKIAAERRKAAEAEAKRELHEAKARHAAQKLRTRKLQYMAAIYTTTTLLLQWRAAPPLISAEQMFRPIL